MSDRGNVLVTGGAGYIGSHTAKALAAAGFTPVVLDNLAVGHRWAVKWGPFIEGDVGDESLIRSIVRDYHIKAVIHFAGSAYISESLSNPRKYINNNVSKCVHLLNAIIDSGVELFVFSSTCATYGDPVLLPIDEQHRQSPINPYGESKLFIERTLHWYGSAHTLRFAALRYFNAAGADPDGEIGETHSPETHLVPLAIQAALGIKGTVTVYGNDFPTPDGTAVRDFVHVTDLAQAHVQALHYLEQGGESSAFNLGLGCGHSVREVIGCVEQTLERPVTAIEAPRREGDPAILVANSDRARTILNWKPALTSLTDIVRTASTWQLRHMHLARREQPSQPAKLFATGSPVA